MESDRPKPAGKHMRISQAARAAGVSTQTVEYYILLGLLRPLRPGNQRGRFFTAAHIRRIRLIRQLNRSGYTLGAIREIHLHKR